MLKQILGTIQLETSLEGQQTLETQVLFFPKKEFNHFEIQGFSYTDAFSAPTPT